MIANIVFDLGGVVFEWRPRELTRRAFADPEAQSLVLDKIIGHRDWVELDRGTLALDDAIDRGAARTGLPSEDVARLFSEVPVSLAPKYDTIELIRSVSETDKRLYVLSNMHLASIDYLERQHDIWAMFDAAVISSRINLVKPEFAIYQYLLSTHDLVAGETVFIDDMPENLHAAATLGINTIRFENAAQCRVALENLRCI